MEATEMNDLAAQALVYASVSNPGVGKRGLHLSLSCGEYLDLFERDVLSR